MLTNEKQYRITKAWIKRFETAATALEEDRPGCVDPIILDAQIAGLKGQIADLQAEAVEYEALKSGGVKRFDDSGVASVGVALIRARIAQGMTQGDLADAMGMKEQQIQRYEAEKYNAASLRRLAEVAAALSVRMEITSTIGDGP